jgi:hypothetical protein
MQFFPRVLNSAQTFLYQLENMMTRNLKLTFGMLSITKSKQHRRKNQTMSKAEFTAPLKGIAIYI